MLSVTIVPAFTDNYIYLLHDPLSGETAAVDPGAAGPVLAALDARQWRLDYIFNTHHHADHIGGNLELRRRTGCAVIAAEHDRHRIDGLTLGVGDGDRVLFGQWRFSVIHTPGHTLGHVAYYCAEAGMLFCGDTLFAMGCGRLFEGSPGQLWQSLETLKALPGDTRVYCAHEYTQANGRFALTLEPGNRALRQRMAAVEALRGQGRPTLPSTIADERATNPFLRAHSLELQATLGMVGQAPVAVFAQTRQLKDRF